ncbi:MAG: hypothetical protein ABW219_15245 [Ilumatobacteraceae bacterium]
MEHILAQVVQAERRAEIDAATRATSPRLPDRRRRARRGRAAVAALACALFPPAR